MSDIIGVEENCVIEHEGKKYESGGSWLLERKDNGKLVGMMYAYPKESKVGNWHGDIKIDARFLQIWNSGFCGYDGRRPKNQLIRFTYQGKNFSGIWYNQEWSDVVRVKQIK